MLSVVTILLSVLLYFVQGVIVYRLGRFLVNFSWAIYVYHIAPRLGFGLDFRKYQKKWTVITGCTDGIGKAYLFVLAQRGLKKFILISRSEGKLEETRKEFLRINDSCEALIFPFTFGQDDNGKLRNFLSDYNIGILVNNVGDAPNALQRFGENYEADKRVSTVNTEAAFELLQMVLPKMKAEKDGVIVNMSSSQSIRPIPFAAAYSASKVYLAYLSECVQKEYASCGITVQCLVPLVVATKLTYYHDSNEMSRLARIFVVPPETFAQQAVASLGITNYTMGCFNHDIQRSFLYLLPWWILWPLVAPLYRLQQARMLALLQKKSENGKVKNGL